MACILLFCSGVTFAEKRPNVVLIMTDNHGAWTLGCYGNEDIRTPNIDRLAREGTLFTQAYASNPVCSPTRATYLTGLMPSQHGVHCFLVGGRLQTGPEARNTLEEFTSLPEILKGEGYSCGLVGKWHLGKNLEPQEGFEDYWITMPHGGTSTFYDARVIEDGEIRNEPEYLTDFWTKHAVNFIEREAKSEKPFFLFLSYNGPYSLSRLLLREGQNRHAAYYADKELPSFPREPAHPWQYNNLDYHNNPTSIRRVATEVSGVDDGVGTVMETLKSNGLDENTIVIFVADQGWAGGQGGYFGMGDHTRPVTADDEMMRVPMIWRQPGKIAADSRSNVMVTNYDFLPTLLGQLGMSDRLPDAPPRPGKDLSGELKQANSTEVGEEAVFYEFEGLRCIRTPEWKYVHRHPNGPHELYNLRNDPDEFTNLVEFSAHRGIRQELKRRLDEYFATYAEPRFDMWNGGGSQTRVFVGVDEEVSQENPVSSPPLPEGFEPPQIDVPDGFSVELVAGPPLVEHPTFATFDDEGRLFVCENAGVNMTAEELEKERPNSIRLLEDVDQDGQFEKSTLFADKMTFPMGGAWHDGALYVASPPNIWRLEDTNGDGVADKRDAIVSEFGYTGNAASIHGCVSGRDGRLYWCDGYHGHEFKNEKGEIVSQRKGSYLFSCRPDGSDVRIHCGGGMDNPVEVDFTREGDMLGTVNIMYTRPRVDCFVHWLYGGAYPHREQVLSELQVTGDFLGPVHRFGHVAVSGTQRYRSGIMNHRWRDNFFATFFNSGKVVRLELEEDGSTFQAQQREFLSSPSRDFHPTDLAEDADGSLLVVDTGGWFYRGCPTSQFARPDVLGGIYRIRRDGMTPPLDPRGNRIEWSSQSISQLARLLGDPRHVVRERAIDECAKRGDAAVPTLSRTIRSRDILPRLGAVWALTRMHPKADAARQAIRLALEDRHPNVRTAACRSLAADPDPQARELLCDLVVEDEEPSVRRVAAVALGRLKDSRSVSSLLASLKRSSDRAFRHSVTYALIEINAADAVRKGLASDHPDVRKASLIALDQMAAGNLTEREVMTQIAHDSPDVQKAAARVYMRHPMWSQQTASVIARLLENQRTLATNANIIRQLLNRSLSEPEVAELVGRELSGKDLSPELRTLLLSVIANQGNLPLVESWAGPLENYLKSPDEELVQLAISAVAAIDTEHFEPFLKDIQSDSRRPAMLRVAAREAQAGQKGRLTDESLELLLKLIEESPRQALAAAQRIGATSLGKPQLLRVTEAFAQASPPVLQELVRPFERSRDAEVAAAFLDSIANSRHLTSVSPVQFSDIIKRYPQDLLPQANEILAEIEQTEQEKIARLDSLISLLEKGNVERGRELFASRKAKCADCHRVADQGGKIGPDLTNIGANRSEQDLLESIVFPSASMVRDYEPYTIATEDGRVLTGLIIRETTETLFVQQQTGDPVEVDRDQVEALSPSGVSIMPAGLDEALTENDLADIVAYLKSLKQSQP